MTALALAAHGSSRDGRAAAPVRRHAEAIARRGLFDEVVCVFFKERPYFGEIFDVTAASSITVVPVMTAQGHYASTVLPRAIRAAAPPSAGRRVAIAPAVGGSKGLAALALGCAQRGAAARGLDLRACRLLLVGHGTWRDPARSGGSTWRAAREAARSGAALSVHVAFLEQLPPIGATLAAIPGGEPVVVVPVLVADAGHAVEDIPAALAPGPARARAPASAGRDVILAAAVGEGSALVELILDAAGAAVPLETLP